jgi:hypothetical protein
VRKTMSGRTTTRRTAAGPISRRSRYGSASLTSTMSNSATLARSRWHSYTLWVGMENCGAGE